MNDFFFNAAIEHVKELLAVTYVWEDSITQKTVAFFSVLNDRIDVDTSHKCKKLRKNIPHEKYYRYYPAVKIGRLGVGIEFQGQSFGCDIIQFIKQFFIHSNKTGCRFVTVDAYNKQNVLNFYIRNGFRYISDVDIDNQTRSMYLELMPAR